MKQNTFNNLYAGGGQGEPSRPYRGSNLDYYINTFTPYYPVKSQTSFGLRHRKLTKKVKSKIKKGTRSVKSSKKTKQHPHKKTKPKPKSRRTKQPKVKKSGKFVLRNGRLNFKV